MGTPDPLDRHFATRPGRDVEAPDGNLGRDLQRDRSTESDTGIAGFEGRGDLWTRMRDVASGEAIRWAGVGLLVVAVVVGVLLRQDGRPVDEMLPLATEGGDVPSAGETVDPNATPSASTTAVVTILVHVAGQVGVPGLVELQQGSRVADAIEAAGGPNVFADLDRLNLAALLSDGQRVDVAAVGDGADRGGVSGAASGSGDTAGGGPAPVDINGADASELEELPGVGPATAAAIISHRTEHGAFRSVDELIEVRGIGPAKLEAIAEVATVGP